MFLQPLLKIIHLFIFENPAQGHGQSGVPGTMGMRWKHTLSGVAGLHAVKCEVKIGKESTS